MDDYRLGVRRRRTGLRLLLLVLLLLRETASRAGLRGGGDADPLLSRRLRSGGGDRLSLGDLLRLGGGLRDRFEPESEPEDEDDVSEYLLRLRRGLLDMLLPESESDAESLSDSLSELDLSPGSARP